MSTDDSRDTFASLFEAEAEPEAAPSKQKPPSLNLGDRCRAEVVQVGRDSVFVEVVEPVFAGRRPQAFIAMEDLAGVKGAALSAGDVVEAQVIEIDAQSGEVRLGWSMGRPGGADALAQAHEGGLPVEGTVTGVNKGGLEVDVSGVRAFCPMSQADRGFLADPQTLVGRTLSFLVTELKEGGRRVVLSRRAVLEREAAEAAGQALAQLTQGTVVRGTITSVREFGAFVDLGGVEGLIPNAELSYDRQVRAQDMLAPGEAVEVQVREIREVTGRRGAPETRITLSLKAMAADPWDDVHALAPEGKVVRGTVSRVVDFGAFVRIAPGLEGLLHVSELGGKVTHPSAVLQAGQSLNVVVRKVDVGARKIGLVPAPDGLEVGAEARTLRLVVGAVVRGTVDRIEPYGVFLQVEGTQGRAGRGLIPIKELGTARGVDVRKTFPVGTTLTAKVLETGEGKLRLSLSAIAADEERAAFDDYRAKTAADGKLGTLGDLLKGE
jgi:small subunit ribosomal protein S1